MTDRGVAWATIDHPPMNLWDVELSFELARVIGEVEADDDVHVLVFASADPEFFIAHADVKMILDLPGEPDEVTEPGIAVRLLDRLRSMPKITIAAIGGIARGGGAEIALSCDLRYVTPSARIGQPEVLLGIIPGAGATQRLARLVGRARALEHVVTGLDITGEEAAANGWANALFPDGDLHDRVRDLAQHVAAQPAEAVRQAKRAVDAAFWDPLPGWIAEVKGFYATLREPDVRERLTRFTEIGGQTRDAELDFESLRRRL